mgnify:CR=1 FL=1
MFKRVFLFALCSGMVPISCYCPDIDAYHAEIQEFSVDPKVNFMKTWPAVVDIDSDTLSFSLSVSKSEIVDNSLLHSFSLTNSAYADECPSDYIQGWVNKVDSILIKSDTIFNGIPAGEIINSKFVGYKWRHFPNGHPEIYTTIKPAIDNFNNYDESSGYANFWIPITILMTDLPSVNSSHIFTFSFYSKGKLINTVSSPEISFQQ